MQTRYIDLSTVRRKDPVDPDRPESVVMSNPGPHADDVYTFDYGPLEVSCKLCGAAFDASEIGKPKDDEFGDGVGWNVCPRCDKPDFLADPLCYETVDEALARMKPKDREKLENQPVDILDEFDSLLLHLNIYRRRVAALKGENERLKEMLYKMAGGKTGALAARLDKQGKRTAKRTKTRSVTNRGKKG